MPSRSFLRLTAVFGLLYAVLSNVGIALQSSGSDLATIVRPTHDEAARIAATSTPTGVWIGLGVGVLGIGMFAAFAAGMADVLRRGEDLTSSWLSRLASGGALVYVALALVSFACWATIYERAGHGLDAQGALLLSDLKSVCFFLSWPAHAVFLGSIGALILRTAALPSWLGWAGLAFGAALLGAATAPTVAQPVVLLGFLWTIAVAVALLLGRRRHLSPNREAAMMRA
jgi:hypothetical protein